MNVTLRFILSSVDWIMSMSDGLLVTAQGHKILGMVIVYQRNMLEQ